MHPTATSRADFSDSHLQKNLAVLSRTNPLLAGRICLPVASDHIQIDGGHAVLLHHRSKHALHIPSPEFERLKRSYAEDHIRLLFGIGDPAQCAEWIRTADRPLEIWERDPYLLRLLLMCDDFSSQLAHGSLRLWLGIDLLEFAGQLKPNQVLAHPTLQQIYENEFRLLQTGLLPARVLLQQGGLFEREVSRFFWKAGYSVYTMDFRRLALEEIQLTLSRFQPQFLFVINYLDGLAELAHEHDVPALCWEIDPFTTRLHKPAAPTDHVHIFCYRPALVQEFRQAGFRHVHHLPMAAATDLRRPQELSKEERSHYGSPLSFVGSSMVEQARLFRNELRTQFAKFYGNPAQRQGALAKVEEILAIQRRNFSSFMVRELMESYFADFLEYARQHFKTDPIHLVAEMAAAEKRLHFLRLAARHGLKVWGDAGWQELAAEGAHYMGPAGRFSEINKIYSAAEINLDVNRLYQKDIVPLRVYEVLACGGFLLAEYSNELARQFEVGRDLIGYEDEASLLEAIQKYLPRAEERRRIAQHGRQTVLERHSFDLRMQTILRALDPAVKAFAQNKAVSQA